MKFEAARIQFLGDVFAAAALVVVGARFEGEGRSRILFSRVIAHLAPYISYWLATCTTSLSYILGQKQIIYDIAFSMFVQLNTRTKNKINNKSNE